MVAVLQRVKSASVTVDGQLISSIGRGVLVFAGVGKDDTAKDAESAAGKLLRMKLWDDENGAKVCSAVRNSHRKLILNQWKRSVQDIQGEILCG